MTAADFQGTPPRAAPVKDNITMVANTMCVVRYSYRIRTNSERDGTWTARLTHFECFSAIEPEKCWNSVPESPRVLDHEQGHFDLAEIFARRLQRRFDELMAGKNASASGLTERVARESLEKEIKKIADDTYEALDRGASDLRQPDAPRHAAPGTAGASALATAGVGPENRGPPQ